ncbi:MAG TPA: acetate--CoA ligase [Acidimicrobiales bacterium]|nr:acetate--CoA ligase [Acidimicrobiales bacterium]
MPEKPIRKVRRGTVEPNLVDYDAACRDFSWDQARARLQGLPDGRGLNIGHEAVDAPASRHPGKVALCFVGKDRAELTYDDLRRLTNRFANVLEHLGVRRGERVATLLGRVPDLYVTVLGALKARAVYSPLFSAFGPEPVRQRLALGDVRVLVTTPSFYKRKVAPVRDDLPNLEHVLLIGAAAPAIVGTQPLAPLMGSASDDYTIGPTDPDDPALLHFTSGTTGAPKGAVHVHGAVVSHHVTGLYALDLHPDDVFWCTADPGWVTGTSYGIISPLTHGVTCVVDEGEFDAERWYATLESEAVTVWYTAPTAIRMLMKAGPALPREHDLSKLRFVASVGEPLHAEGVRWGCDVLGLPIHDNWWQTETGGIMIANFASSDIYPGSMGRPLPGIIAAVARRDDEGNVITNDGVPEFAGDDERGELVLRRGWPSMFRGYLGMDDRYEACFTGDWYRTGDVVRRDANGWFWFLGRGDDVIKSAGHLIGPFEVESTLMAHPAVLEAGVIGKPDPVAGEVVKAFVTVRAGVDPSDDLALELIGFARSRLGAAVAPREIEFDDHLPKTKSGKILRRLLKARELGLPEGDLSTLEVSH